LERKAVNCPWFGDNRLSAMMAVRKMRAMPMMIAFCWAFRL
jgi:hypothetical protein